MDKAKECVETIFKDNPSLLNYVDGTLQTGDGYTFPIHKIALAKCNKYFLALFCGVGKGKNEYLIPGITGEVLSNILSYIYTEKIFITEENICDIIVASDYLLLDDLLSHVMTLLEKNLCLRNCLDIHLWLTKLSMKDCFKLTYRFIETRFEEIVCNTDINVCEWPFEFVEQLLNDRNLRVQNEKVIWKVIVRWVEADLLHRLCRVPGLLMYLRIDDVDENLAAEIVTHDIVARNAFCGGINLRSKAKYRDILRSQQYSVSNGIRLFPFDFPRKPLRLNFIAYYCSKASTDKIELFVTYDESLDLWRKIIEVHLHPNFLVSIGDCIYLFKFPNEKLRYNVIEKAWIDFSDLKIQRYGYAVVALGGFIYAIGGIFDNNNSQDSLGTSFDVEIYDPKEDSWHVTVPMLPTIYFPKAVTLNGCIYVVGRNNLLNDICAQMYNPSTKTWSELPAPSIDTYAFALAAYKGKIYIFCNNILKSVHVFDPLKTSWYSEERLPYSYFLPRVLVINDHLIVSEDHRSKKVLRKINPPVQWNKDRNTWETIEETSPYFNMHDYFCTFQEGDSINIISMENKKPTCVFEKSPFS